MKLPQGRDGTGDCPVTKSAAGDASWLHPGNRYDVVLAMGSFGDGWTIVGASSHLYSPTALKAENTPKKNSETTPGSAGRSELAGFVLMGGRVEAPSPREAPGGSYPYS